MGCLVSSHTHAGWSICHRRRRTRIGGFRFPRGKRGDADALQIRIRCYLRVGDCFWVYGANKCSVFWFTTLSSGLWRPRESPPGSRITVVPSASCRSSVGWASAGHQPCIGRPSSFQLYSIWPCPESWLSVVFASIEFERLSVDIWSGFSFWRSVAGRQSTCDRSTSTDSRPMLDSTCHLDMIRHSPVLPLTRRLKRDGPMLLQDWCPVYDFYHDPNVNETIRIRPVLQGLMGRLKELLAEWPGHPTLSEVRLPENVSTPFTCSPFSWIANC